MDLWVVLLRSVHCGVIWGVVGGPLGRSQRGCVRMADTSQSSQDVSIECQMGSDHGWSPPRAHPGKEIAFLVTKNKSNYVTTMAESFKLTPPPP
jgi:hypothetical protein